MERKLKYMAPAILEELKIEMEGSILTDSNTEGPTIDENFEKVETMGQEIGGVIDESNWSHIW